MIRRGIVPVLERIRATRVVAVPAALEAVHWPPGILVLRIAPDEALAIPNCEPQVGDPHAIVESEHGFSGVWVSAEDARSLLERHCEWEAPVQRPAFAQGSIAEIPAKIWLDQERALLLVPAPYAAEFEERIS
jgi:hypothetical protein